MEMDLRLLVDSVDRFFADRHAEILRGECGDARGAPSFWRECAEMGWPQACVPASAGGAGLGTSGAAALVEAMGAYLPPVPVTDGMAVAALLAEAGIDAQVDVPEGRELWSCLQGAQPMGIVEGPIVLYAAGGHAWRLAWENGLLSLEQVASSPAGYGVDPLIPVAAAGTRRRMASLPCGQAPWRRYAGRLRCLLLAEALGAASAALGLAVRHAREREQFGRPIGANQAIKHRLADNRMALDDARLALHAACEAVDMQDERMEERLAMAELLVQEAAHATVGQAVQTHGAMGITWECPVHFHFKRVKHIGARLRRERDSAAILERIWELA